MRSRRDHGVRLRGPTKSSNGWQGRDGGLTVDAFRVDWRRQRVTCPAGQTSNTWRTYDGAAVETGRGRDLYVKVRFAPSVCGSCALRARCVRTPGRRGRQLMLHPQAEQEALAAARAHHASRRGRRAYAIRSGIEGTVSQAVQALGLRRALPRAREDARPGRRDGRRPQRRPDRRLARRPAARPDAHVPLRPARGLTSSIRQQHPVRLCDGAVRSSETLGNPAQRDGATRDTLCDAFRDRGRLVVRNDLNRTWAG